MFSSTFSPPSWFQPHTLFFPISAKETANHTLDYCEKDFTNREFSDPYSLWVFKFQGQRSLIINWWIRILILWTHRMGWANVGLPLGNDAALCEPTESSPWASGKQQGLALELGESSRPANAFLLQHLLLQSHWDGGTCPSTDARGHGSLCLVCLSALPSAILAPSSGSSCLCPKNGPYLKE